VRNGREVPLTEWGAELLQAFAPIAQALDAAHGSSDYSAAVRAAQRPCAIRRRCRRPGAGRHGRRP